MRFDYLAILVLLGLDQGIEFGVVHEHFLLYLGKGDENFLLEVLALGVGIIEQFLDAIDLNKKLGVFDFFMPELKKALLQRFGNAGQCHPNFVNRLAIVIHPHLDIQLLSQQKQVLLDLEHQLLDNPVHVLQNGLSRYVLVYLPAVLPVQAPLRMHLCDVFEAVVQVVVVEFERAQCFHLLLAVLVDAEGYYLLLVLDTPVLLPLVHY